MPSDLLPVPHLKQAYDGQCLPICAAMVLEFLGQPTPVEKIENLLGTIYGGTILSRIQRLERWRHSVTYRNASVAEIRYWLTAGLPPIAMVLTGFLDYWEVNTPHAVVVVGLDGNTIYLNDPAQDDAPIATNLDGFIAAWIEMDEKVAVIQV